MNKLTRILSLVLALVLLCCDLPTTAYAKSDVIHGVATVNASSLRLRSEASTSSKTLDNAYRGEVVVVLSKEGDWYKVIYDLQEGFMHSDYLKVKTAADVELGYGRVNGNSVNLRSGAGTSYKRVDKANEGDKAYIIGVNDGWYKIIFEKNVCYIRSDYLDLTEVPYENKSSDNKPLFFKGGISTGVTVSASALNGTTDNSSNSSASDSKNDKDTKDEKEDKETELSDGVKYGVAFTTGSGLRLRSEASTKSSTLASAAKGEVVVVVSKSGSWCKVIYNLKEGYMHADYLDVETTENVELGYGTFNAKSVNIRSGAGTSNSKVATASKGDKAYIIGINDGWYKIIYGDKIGYVRSDYLDLTEYPYENKASSNAPLFFRRGKSTGIEVSAAALNGGATSSGSSDKNESSSSGSSSSSSSGGAKIVETAKKYLGVPYVWGGSSPSGFDCSGFVYYVMRSCGYSVSRTSSSMYKNGTPIEKSDLQPGDIVFFQNTYKAGISHVGIYVGDGKFIHSPSTGSYVSYADLYSDYYTSHYYGACRVY